MRKSIRTITLCASILGGLLSVPGCAASPRFYNSTAIENKTAGFVPQQTPRSATPGTNDLPRSVRVIGVKMLPDKVVQLATEPAKPTDTGENIIDLTTSSGLINYLCSTYPRQTIGRVVVTDAQGETLKQIKLSTKRTVSQSVNANDATFAIGQHIQVPPPGVTIDHAINPVAGVNALPAEKADAIITVASTLEGTPYVWGHNKDRGQNGFDCSNFVAYVYHHALGYKMSDNSKVQWSTTGFTVPIWDMRKGDLLLFDNGKHVGIYAGNDQMIQAGGGLGHVGTLPLGPDSYWGKQLSAVRRMF
ncbi:C40 family peptidase [Alicyclobacillus dauci]|uniref:C40 family peptidase n=1 Tax=Alicyclobacillus dauci TaxID=1475485 RepID=A0ABY6Z3G8_9BACL|nr:C40 family peptidase [Alicyclobacillus dauci]WAH36876.1 C40 family peptidase [Alicyclobacillus dauci]